MTSSEGFLHCRYTTAFLDLGFVSYMSFVNLQPMYCVSLMVALLIMLFIFCHSYQGLCLTPPVAIQSQVHC